MLFRLQNKSAVNSVVATIVSAAAAAILWFFAIWTAGSFAAFAFGLPDFGPILGLIAGVLVTVGYGRLAQPAPQLGGPDAQPVPQASVS